MISNTKVTTLFSWRDYKEQIREWLQNIDDLDKEEYEIPLCFCRRGAMLRTSRSEDNWLRPFFNCSEPVNNQQCGFFQWVDVFLSIAMAHEEIKRTTDDKASLVRVKQEPLEESSETPDHIKKRVKDDHANATGDIPTFIKVKDEPLDQDRNESGHEDDSACENCHKLKRKVDDDKASWDKEKLELLSELALMKKKAKLAESLN